MLHKNKWMMMLVALLALIMISGCGNDGAEDAAEEDPAQETPAEEGKEQEENDQKSDTTLESDQDLTQKLEAEKGIESVMVQVVGGDQQAVNVDIEINEEQELSAKEVIEKYGAVIKEEYTDHTIDIIVVKDGKIQQQATLD
ncbi:hypothetical protein [Bacillus dakarensis]|uniref:hypothetical protein n=1 Tax=Robertmurraya dakarensis TaxID=1926278 RepID=UPI0009814149|nr:hypothetical protein [Bacillus dakarensis]